MALAVLIAVVSVYGIVPVARAGPTVDCNNNAIPDNCDLSCGPPGGACDVPGCGLSADCNANDIPDECDIANCTGDPACGDCNLNGVPDGCDLTTPLAKLHQQDMVGSLEDQFGRSAAIDGGTLVIGAPLDDSAADTAGAAYVYVHDDSGTPTDPGDDTWNLQATLLAQNVGSGEFFGHSVAIEGNTIVVGAPQDATAGLYAGATYVFEKDVNAPWHDGAVDQVAKLLPDELFDPGDSERFGISVAIDGNTIVAGAPSGGTSYAGAVYVFTRAGGPTGGWDDGSADQEARLVPTNSSVQDEFGGAVDIDGNTIVAGSVRRFSPTEGGFAVVFIRGPNNTWDDEAVDQQEILMGVQPGEYFGTAVGISGDTVIVGSPHHLPLGPDGLAGAAHVFLRSGETWTHQATLRPFDNVPGDQFGNSVAISDETIIAAALTDDEGGLDSGSAYVFRRGPNGVWDDGYTDQLAKLVPDDGATGDRFGIAVAFSGDWVVGGAFQDDDPGPDSGSAYLFEIGSIDCNANGIPDECELPLPLCQCETVCQCANTVVGSGGFQAGVGGCLVTPDSALEICIEPGDLFEKATLSVAEVPITERDVELLLTPAPGRGVAVALYDLDPDGLTFQNPVDLTITKDVSGLNRNQRERLDLYFRDDAGGPFEPLGATCCVDEVPPGSGTFLGKCTTPLTHFSTYGFIGPLDTDGDGVFDDFAGIMDNCPTVANPKQEDPDGDGIGHACDNQDIPTVSAWGLAAMALTVVFVVGAVLKRRRVSSL